jgi:hypothetical protein
VWTETVVVQCYIELASMYNLTIPRDMPVWTETVVVQCYIELASMYNLTIPRDMPVALLVGYTLNDRNPISIVDIYHN